MEMFGGTPLRFRSLVLFLLLLLSHQASALDVAIRILAIAPVGTTGDPFIMNGRLNEIVTSWTWTGVHTASGVNVEILNNGTPIYVSLPGMPSDVAAASQWAPNDPTIIQQRNAYAADVIVLFTDGTSLCGAAEAGFTNGNFLPDAQGIDVRYRNASYVAVVSNSMGCSLINAPHELGHLLGAGHIDPSMQNNPRLYADSRAYLHQYYGEYGPAGDATVMTDGPECIVTLPGGGMCFHISMYSHNATNRGNGNQQNKRTLEKTALSVANYFQSSPPPGQILNPPINVHGYLITTCTPDGGTRHDIYWSPDPNTNVPVTRYEVWASQPPGGAYTYHWSVPSYQTFDDTYVYGAHAEAKLRACTDTECSQLSTSSYLATYQCNW